MDKLTDLAAKMRAASAQPQWHYLQSPLTSTSWDGDSYSTTAKTLIDLSAVFGVPAGAKAVLIGLNIRDSASTTSHCYMVLSPNDISGSGLVHWASKVVNDLYQFATIVVPCDSNGDVYYQIVASGAGTMDVIVEIWGYLI